MMKRQVGDSAAAEAAEEEEEERKRKRGRGAGGRLSRLDLEMLLLLAREEGLGVMHLDSVGYGVWGYVGFEQPACMQLLGMLGACACVSVCERVCVCVCVCV